MAIGRPLNLTANVASKNISVLATAGQTSFTVTGGYRINEIAVYRNGTRLADGRDFTATDGSIVTLVSAATIYDVIEYQIFDSFNVANAVGTSGDSTIDGNLTLTGSLDVSAFGDINQSATGITTLSTLKVGTAATINSSGLDVVGIASVGTAITMYGSSGIVSATSFYGDGSNLSNIISGVGVNSGGTNIGYGVTTLNFVGSGTTIEVSGTTANISAGGGSGVSTTGILTARGFANADDITESITLDDYYGTGTNYGMVGPITVTGAGTTITVGVGVSYVII